jgi:hypothetical protein
MQNSQGGKSWFYDSMILVIPNDSMDSEWFYGFYVIPVIPLIPRDSKGFQVIPLIPWWFHQLIPNDSIDSEWFYGFW